MTRARILTIERTPRWSVRMRALGGRLAVNEARSLPLASDAIDADEPAVAVLVVDDFSGAAAWEWLVATARRPFAPAIVVACEPREANSDAMWAWLQAGAARVVSSPLEARFVARLASRVDRPSTSTIDAASRGR